MSGFNKKTIRDIDIDGKRVIMRVDFNVPLDEHGEIVDDYRIHQTLPTLHYLIERDCKVVLMSHLGRPGGEVVPSMSLAPVARRLRELLHGTTVNFTDDCIGEAAAKEAKKLGKGEVLLLENVRFHDGDEKGDKDFAKQLSAHGKIFVLDAFGVAHRKHASVTGVGEYLPSVAGLLLEKEMTIIGDAMADPKRPLMAVIGGAKIADKIKALDRFVDTADAVAIVGAMANTFLLAQGYEVGSSLVDKDEVPLAKEILAKAETRQKDGRFTLIIPSDVVVSEALDGSQSTRVVDLSENTLADIQSYPKAPSTESSTVSDSELILDAGPISAARISGVISQMHTVVWSGTAGVAETKGLSGAANPFEHGTRTIVNAMVGPNAAFTIVGGGDTVSYVESIDGLREKWAT